MSVKLSDLYKKIDNLVELQNSLCVEKYGDSVPDNIFELFFDYQRQMNSLSELITKARSRATSEFIHKELMGVSRVSTDGRRKSEYLWLTVNPRPDVDLSRFLILSHEAMKLSVFDSGQYVFEQRGVSEGSYPGFHLHALMKRSKSPSIVEKELKRKFDSVVGNPLHIRISWVNEDQLDKIRKYMSGDKKDKDKEPKALNDKNFRKDNNLMSLYTLRTPENLLGGAKIRTKLKLKIT
ncbi:MAG: replication associated protein [Wigfec virus K19_615]|nr:MAG: replication associated protein [Wigfec virus K19_615]